MPFPRAQLLPVSLRFLCITQELPVESRTREDQKEAGTEDVNVSATSLPPGSSPRQGRTLKFLFRVPLPKISTNILSRGEINNSLIQGGFSRKESGILSDLELFPGVSEGPGADGGPGRRLRGTTWAGSWTPTQVLSASLLGLSSL